MTTINTDKPPAHTVGLARGAVEEPEELWAMSGEERVAAMYAGGQRRPDDHRAAAAELPAVNLEDALRVALLVCEHEPENAERAACAGSCDGGSSTTKPRSPT